MFILLKQAVLSSRVFSFHHQLDLQHQTWSA